MADHARFVIYLDRSGEYRWRLRAPNGEVIADSAEGYTSNAECRRAIGRVKTYAPIAELVDMTR